MKNRDDKSMDAGEEATPARKWLEAHARSVTPPQPARKRALRQRMLAGLAPRRGRRPGLRVGLALQLAGVAALVLVISAAGIVDASAAALPGESLFSIKLLVEDLELMLARTPEARSGIMAHRIDTRLLEIIQLQSMGDFGGVAQGLALLEDLLVQSEGFPPTPALEESLVHSREVLLNALPAQFGDAPAGLDSALEALNSASDKAGLPPVSEQAETPTATPSEAAEEPASTLEGGEGDDENASETPTPTAEATPTSTPTKPGNFGNAPGGTPTASGNPENGNSGNAPGRQDENPGRGNGGPPDDDSTNGTPPGHENKKKNEDKMKGGKD
jgi:hypothetical protein